MKTYDHVHLLPVLARWIQYRRLCAWKWLALRLYIAWDNANSAVKRLEGEL